MCNPVLLETERLTLRMFTPDDFEDLHALISDPDVMEYYPKVSSREDSGMWFQGILRDYQTNGYGMLAVQLKETGEFVGQVGIVSRPAETCAIHYFAYLICKRFWRQGYATEAAQSLLDYGFGTLGVDKVTALIRTDNARSIRLAEKLGLQRESTTLHQGRDHYVYTLTR